VLVLDVVPSSAAPAQATRRVDLSGDARALRLAAARLARDLNAEPVAIAAGGLRGARLTAFVEGLVLGAYRFDRYRTGPAQGRTRVELLGVDDEAALAAGLRLAAATSWARDLTNTPASDKTPQWLADAACRGLADSGVEVEVRDEPWLRDHGFGGVLAVGGGSAHPPRLIEARWRPRGARRGVHPVIVGKGITFDTGGLNLKPGESMRMMHTDMAGGAAALAALRAVAQAEVPIRVSVLVPAAENAFSGSSFRPGDVIRHVGGRTSEVTNTDAEGRLVLADALAYAAKQLRPSALVDIATLTGAMKVALGLRTAGLFATSDRLANALARAGELAGEPVWRMPLADEYLGALESPVADADNAPGNPGAITAALFLRPFTGGLPWAHLDIAGPARASDDDPVLSRGATGFGARLLARWIESLAG
jgi:leucyl aminopeptidase